MRDSLFANRVDPNSAPRPNALLPLSLPQAYRSELLLRAANRDVPKLPIIKRQRHATGGH
jgi:hypothetical protein